MAQKVQFSIKSQHHKTHLCCVTHLTGISSVNINQSPQNIENYPQTVFGPMQANRNSETLQKSNSIPFIMFVLGQQMSQLFDRQLANQLNMQFQCIFCFCTIKYVNETGLLIEHTKHCTKICILLKLVYIVLVLFITSQLSALLAVGKANQRTTITMHYSII